ncbi:MAG: CpsD/CapB family tyrosine-protein kinase [SAR202 cluster bacterium]|nr:CpsD/CapB family tyrosine-protein kinase [SAR202 cluster bacterium]
MVTSPGPGDGKSTIISNISVTLAQTGKRIVVIDGDMRRPTMHKRFNLQTKEPGVSNFLAEPTTTVGQVLHKTAVEGVFVIPGGPIPPNPAELLGSPRMKVLIEQLKEQFDIVLVDSPPVLVVADSAIIAAQVDGAIAVVDGLKTRSSSLKAALDTLRNTQVNIVGVVINKLKRVRFGYGYNYPYYYDYYYYSYYYSYYAAEEGAKTNGHTPAYRKPLDWTRDLLAGKPKNPN